MKKLVEVSVIYTEINIIKEKIFKVAYYGIESFNLKYGNSYLQVVGKDLGILESFNHNNVINVKFKWEETQ